MKNLGPSFSLSWHRVFSGGCMVGPKYHKPAVQNSCGIPRIARKSASANSGSFVRGSSLVAKSFQDPQLQELIPHRLENKITTCSLPRKRIKAERAQLAITRSYLFPQVQGSGDFHGRQRKEFSVEIKFLRAYRRCCLPAGNLFGKLRRENRSGARPASGNGRCPAHGDAHACQRRGE